MIRFKKEDGGEYPKWEIKNINSLGIFKGGGTPNTNNEEFWNGNIPWISSSCLYDSSIFKVHIDKFITDKAYQNSATKLIDKNSILIVTRVGMGKVAIAPCDLCTSQDYISLELNGENNTEYIAYAIKNKLEKEKLKVQGTSIKGITSGEIKKLQINLPCIEEQKKIADFLSSVDEVIETSEEEIEQLEQQKKGTMQKIFNQEVRFKDDNGNQYPEWEAAEFKEIIKTIPSKKYQINSKEYLDIGKYEVVDQGKQQIIGYSNDESKVYKRVPVIVYGDHTTIVKYRNKEFIVGADGTKLLECKNDCNNLKYFYYNIVERNVKQQGYKRHFSDLTNITLDVPCLEEQEKIADFLSSMDEAIDYAKKELEAWKQLKKGLLQQMFM